MAKSKSIRQKGKLRLGDYFKKLENNDSVAVINERSVPTAFPERIVGKSGKIVGQRGTYKVVELKDGNLMKQYIIHPINLKKLK